MQFGMNSRSTSHGDLKKWHFLESSEFLNFRLNLSASWNPPCFQSDFFFFKKALCQSSKNEAANLKKTCWFKIICKINDFEFSCCFDCGQLSVGSMNAIDCCCRFILVFAVIVCGVVLQLKIWNQQKNNKLIRHPNQRPNERKDGELHMICCVSFSQY